MDELPATSGLFWAKAFTSVDAFMQSHGKMGAPVAAMAGDLWVTDRTVGDAVHTGSEDAGPPGFGDGMHGAGVKLGNVGATIHLLWC